MSGRPVGQTRYDEVVDRVATLFDNDCWVFPNQHADYPQVRIDGVKVKAHILAYRLRYGSPSLDLVHHHTCENTGCWNPNHIEPVTNAENIKLSGKQDTHSHITHCPYGHPYSATNTRYKPTKWGGVNRICRECGRNYARQRHVKQRAKDLRLERGIP